MHAKDVILGVYDTSDRIMGAYLGDLTDEELLARPVDGQNHVAWQLGHLISVENQLINALKPGTAPALPEGFDDVYGRDDASTGSNDASKFLPKARYQELMKANRDAARAALDSMTDADLDAPGPERVRKMAPTAGATFLLIGTHTLMHIGQFVSVRRSLKKPIAI